MDKVKQIPTNKKYAPESILLGLSKVSQALQGTKSLEDVYRKFGESINELGFAATILSLHNSGKYLTTTYQTRKTERMKRLSNKIGVSIDEYRVPVRKNGILDQVITSGRTMFLESKTEILLEIFPEGIRPLIKRMVKKDGGETQSIIAPLWFDNKVTGVIGVSGATISDVEIPAITVFADQLSAALMNVKAYSALQEREEEKFRIMFESAPDAYYLSDLKGKFLDGNKQAERITGFSKEELIGKSFLKLNLLPKSQLPAAAVLLAKNRLGKSTGPDGFTLFRKDGKEIEIEIQTHPVNIEGKSVVLGIARDITERKLAEEMLNENEERYRTIFESVYDAIILINKSGKIIDINDRVTDISGYKREDVVDKNFTRLGAFSPKDLTGMLKLFGKAVRGNVQEIKEWPIRHKNGTMITVEASAKLVKKNGKIEGIVAILRDITERIQSEKIIKRRLDELSILQEVSSICLNNMEEDQTIAQVTRIIGNRLYHDHFGVMLLDEEKGVLRIHPSYQGLEPEDSDFEIKLGEGVVGRVAKTNKPLRIDNIAEEENYIAPKFGQSSELCVPISVNGKVFGVINTESSQKDAFSLSDERLLKIVADQLAVALQKSRLYMSEQKRRLEAEANREASEFLTMSLDLDDVLDNILDSLRKVIDSDQASIHLFEEDHIRIVAGRGFKNLEEVIGYKYSFENQLVIEMVNSNSPLVLEDALQDSSFQNLGLVNIRGWMGTPLIEQGTAFGFISVDSHTPGAFSQRDAELVQIFANNAAAAIVKARLFAGEKKRRLEAEILGEISTELTSAQDLQSVLNSILKNLQRSLDFDSAGILLQDNGRMRIVATHGFSNTEELDKLVVSPDLPLYQEILQTKKVLIIEDVLEDDRFRDFGTNVEIRGWMGVPLIDQGQVIGFVSFDSNTPGKFNNEMARLAQMLVNQTSSAITKAKSFEDTQLALKRLEALHEIDRIITSSVELSFAIKKILQIIISRLGVDAANVMRFGPNSLTLFPSGSVGIYENLAHHNIPQPGNIFVKKIALDRKIIFLSEQEEINSHFANNPELLEEGIKSYLGVPLITKGEVKGVLELFHRSSLEINQEWEGFLETLATQLAIAIDNSLMFENLQKSNMELTLSYDATIEGWAKALEMRDMETEGHSRRVVNLAQILAKTMGFSGLKLAHLRRGALLHDIGKMAVPDAILQKTGDLSDDEWEIMQNHPTYARDWLSSTEYLRPALDIPYCHHEKWDGSGYPRGLKGEEIPLPARIFAVVDVYDALRSDRPYRKAWSKNKVTRYIEEQSGKHFDPRVVEKFLELVKNPQIE